MNISDEDVHIYSLNIAQQNHLRTMLMFNKIHSFIKGKDISESFINTNFFNHLPNIILKHRLHVYSIVEGSKVEIFNEAILEDLRKLIPIPFEKAYLRRYTPSGERQTDEIFEKRFKQTNYIYIDIVFKRETNSEYRYRIFKILETIENIIGKKKTVWFVFKKFHRYPSFKKS